MAVDAQCRSSAGNEASARRSGDSRRPRTPDIAGPDAIESAQASYLQLPARAVLSRSASKSHRAKGGCRSSRAPRNARTTLPRGHPIAAPGASTHIPESDAWRSSRSRSSSPPRQWTSTTTVASRAASTCRRRSNETSAVRPRSISETVDRPTPASLARSACRQPRRRRKARTVAPMRSDRTPTLCAQIHFTAAQREVHRLLLAAGRPAFPLGWQR